MIVARIKAYQDSVALANSGRRSNDWTFERGGKKYGLDEKGLHLGGITIPRQLLPTFQATNPTAIERERAISMMNREIREQAQRAMTEDEFRAAVKRIRERKERERREQQPRQTAGSGTSTPPP